MNKKIIVVTGGTDGIGLALVKKLIKLNYNIFIIGKNAEKGNKVLNDLNYPDLEFFQCDLSEKNEIKKLIKKFKNVKLIDSLINNAGAIYDKRLENSHNVEKTFALNHLSYFHLSFGLLEKLEKSNHGRIVNVTSNIHKKYNLDLEDLENKKQYSGWKSYCRSKLLNIYFTYSFNKELSTKVKCNCFHPGFVNSNFGNNNNTFYRFLIKIVKNFLAISTDKASKPLFELTNSDEFNNVTNKYFFKLKEKKSSEQSYNLKIAKYVWDVSHKYIV
jgi:retinol dehydrogenase 12